MTIEMNVYQIYYKEEQKREHYLDTRPYFNQDLGLYFENDVILNLYDRGKIKGDFFGVLSWKNRRKNHIKRTRLKPLLSRQYDIFSFTYDRHDVLGYASICHPEFAPIFAALLNAMNINPQTRPIVGLYQNAIIARPWIYREYVEEYLLPAIDFLESAPELIEHLLFADANYLGVQGEKLEGSLGVDHYTHHPFVLERLWSLYYDRKRKKRSLRYYIDKNSRTSREPSQVQSKGRLHKIRL